MARSKNTAIVVRRLPPAGASTDFPSRARMHRSSRGFRRVRRPRPEGLAVLMSLFVLAALGAAPGPIEAIPAAPPAPREFRAVWVATVENIDWPTRPGLPV